MNLITCYVLACAVLCLNTNVATGQNRFVPFASFVEGLIMRNANQAIEGKDKRKRIKEFVQFEKINFQFKKKTT